MTLTKASSKSGIASATVSVQKLPAPPDPSWGTFLPQFSQELLDITNAFRLSKGIGPLAFDSRLVASSLWKSANMAGFLYEDHDDPAQPLFPSGRTIGARFVAYYPVGYAWGENIAYGFLDAQSVFDAWVSQGPGEGHYDNIVSPSFIGCGMNAVQASNGLIFWTQDFGSAPILIPPDPGDHTPPTIPGNFRSTGTTSTSVNLAWDASTDNNAVQGYELFQDGNKIGNIYTLSTTIHGLVTGSTHTYSVDAFDYNNNFSNKSNITVTIGTPSININSVWKNKKTGKLVTVVAVTSTQVTWKKVLTKTVTITSFLKSFDHVSG